MKPLSKERLKEIEENVKWIKKEPAFYLGVVEDMLDLHKEMKRLRKALEVIGKNHYCQLYEHAYETRHASSFHIDDYFADDVECPTCIANEALTTGYKRKK